MHSFSYLKYPCGHSETHSVLSFILKLFLYLSGLEPKHASVQFFPIKNVFAGHWETQKFPFLKKLFEHFSWHWYPCLVSCKTLVSMHSDIFVQTSFIMAWVFLGQIWIHALVPLINIVPLVQKLELKHVLPIFVNIYRELLLAQCETHIPFSMYSDCSGHLSMQV